MFRRMKKTAFLFVALLALASCGAGKTTAQSVSDRPIVIFHDNDVHCAIDGYPIFAGARDAVLAADTAWVLTTSSGDFMQGGTPGTLSSGQYPVDIMTAVGYDAIGLGNHEFDYHTPRMLEALDGMPVTCVNFSPVGEKMTYAPYIMKQCGKRKVALVGVVTPDAMDSEAYSFFDNEGKQLYDLYRDKCYSLVQKAVDDARKAGADYVVVISHLGETDSPITSVGLVQATVGIDAVVDGHTHSVIERLEAKNKEGKSVVITQTGTQFAYVGKLVIGNDGKISSVLIPAAQAPKSAKVQHCVDSIKQIYNEIAMKPLGRSEVNLSILGADGKRIIRRGEANIGDFVADAFRIVGNSQISLVNSGAVRTNIPVGDLCFKSIIDVMPFGNKCSLLKISGDKIRRTLSRSVSHLPEEYGEFLQVSGLKYSVKGNTLTDVQVQDRASGQYSPLRDDELYTVAMSDYVLGIYSDILTEPEYIKKSYAVDYDILYDYIVNNLGGVIGSMYEKSQGRISIE